MKHTLGDAAIEAQYQEVMHNLANALDEVLNGDARGLDRVNGFVLIVFPFGDDSSRCNYISNAERKDVVIMLKEQIKRFEGQPEIKGRA